MKNILASDVMGGILFDIQKERERQEELLRQDKFPWSCDDLKISDVKKLAVLAEEFGEVSKEVAQIEEQYDRLALFPPGYVLTELTKGLISILRDGIISRKENLREELIQVAAVCVAWCEALDVQLDDRKDVVVEPMKCEGAFDGKDCELERGHNGKCGMLP